MEQPLISGIAYNRSQAKLTLLRVPNTVGVAAKIIHSVSSANIAIDIIVQNVAADGATDFSFTVHRDDYQKALTILQKNTNALDGCVVLGDNTIGKLSLLGVGMRSHAIVADTMFRTLAEKNINIQMITTSEIKISVVIDEEHIKHGVAALNAAFQLKSKPCEEIDPYSEK